MHFEKDFFAMRGFALLTILVQAAAVLSSPVQPDAALATSVTVNGQTFVNKLRVVF